MFSLTPNQMTKSDGTIKIWFLDFLELPRLLIGGRNRGARKCSRKGRNGGAKGRWSEQGSTKGREKGGFHTMKTRENGSVTGLASIFRPFLPKAMFRRDASFSRSLGESRRFHFRIFRANFEEFLFWKFISFVSKLRCLISSAELISDSFRVTGARNLISKSWNFRNWKPLGERSRMVQTQGESESKAECHEAQG